MTLLPNRNITVYRALCILGGSFYMAFWYLYTYHFLLNDPLALRVVQSSLFFGAFAFSYGSRWIRRHYDQVMRYVIYAMMVHFVILLYINDLHLLYVAGTLLVLAAVTSVYPYSFVDRKSLSWFLGLVTLGMLVVVGVSEGRDAARIFMVLALATWVAISYTSQNSWLYAIERLSESEDRYKSLIEVLPEAMLVHVNGKVVYANQSAAKLLNAEEQYELIDLPISRFIHPEYKNEVEQRIIQVKEKKQQVPMQRQKMVGLDHSVVEVEVVAAPFNYKGQDAVQVVIRDISHQLKIEQRLIEARNEAEEMNELKNAFLANISHEIRTPLNSVIGFASVLLEDEKNESKKDLLGRILRNGKRLMDTILSILDLSNIEADTVDMAFEEVDIGNLAKSCIGNYKQIAENQNIQLQYSLPEEQVLAYGDHEAIKKIIDNLLNNALTFTPKGYVSIEVGNIKRNGSEERAYIKVEDTGIGISEEFKEKLYQPFWQESSGYDRSFEGTGLGLTIVKQFTNKMNGTIEVESEIGKGSIFTILLPAQHQQVYGSQLARG